MNQSTISKPQLREIPLSEVKLGPGTVMFTMSTGQWDALLAAGYERGYYLLELNDNEQPVRAYRKAINLN